MSISVWFVYAMVAIVSIISPGPAIFLAITNSINHGIQSVVYSSVGKIFGLFIISSISFAGVGAVLAASAELFLALKIIGAGYLMYLGIRQWRSKVSLFSKLKNQENKTAKSTATLFAQGMLLAITNPKAILFFTALFPQFIQEDRNIISQFLILTLTFMLFSFCSLMSYALVARFARAWLAGSRGSSLFNRVFGFIFVGLGIGMLTVHNVS